MGIFTFRLVDYFLVPIPGIHVAGTKTKIISQEFISQILGIDIQNYANKATEDQPFHQLRKSPA
jgi:hypothetical protein